LFVAFCFIFCFIFFVLLVRLFGCFVVYFVLLFGVWLLFFLFLFCFIRFVSIYNIKSCFYFSQTIIKICAFHLTKLIHIIGKL
jgi:hypothetical protein